MYGCESWSTTLRLKLGRSVFENRVLRIIFESKRDEVPVDWRRLHIEKLYDLYCSHDKRVRWAGHVARMGRGKVHKGFW